MPSVCAARSNGIIAGFKAGALFLLREISWAGRRVPGRQGPNHPVPLASRKLIILSRHRADANLIGVAIAGISAGSS